MASPITVDYVSDWAARLRSRLYTQFRNKVTWSKWVTLLARQAQDLEDAAQSLFGMYDIDNSSGVQLDVIGRIVGQSRNSLDDVTYRLFLRARIATNLSDGDPESIYQVFVALYGGTVSMVITTGMVGPKEYSLRIKTVLTRTQALAGVPFLGDATEAGTRPLLEWQESATGALFVYDGTTAQGYDAGVYAGAAQG